MHIQDEILDFFKLNKYFNILKMLGAYLTSNLLLPHINLTSNNCRHYCSFSSKMILFPVKNGYFLTGNSFIFHEILAGYLVFET